MVALVGAVRVDGVGGEDFAGREVGGGDGAPVGEDEDRGVGVVDADTEEVHAAGAADAAIVEAVDGAVLMRRSPWSR